MDRIYQHHVAELTERGFVDVPRGTCGVFEALILAVDEGVKEVKDEAVRENTIT